MADRIGTEIAGYRIESLIARGGMGEVYLAAQAFPERKVALKLLPHDLASDPVFRERFIRESNAAASLEHPNIVPVYGAGESDGELWIAMRFVDGEDLRSLLEQEARLRADRALSICSQVADALEQAHEHGLVHRDVKPGNILVGKGDRAYLTDFGLIRPFELETSLTKTGQLMGTVDYVAPEQIRGQAVDGRVDVYSLGCVLFECLTGEPPFRRDTEVATLYAHLEDPPPVPSAKVEPTPSGLDEVVATAMAKAPEERFATAGELGTALRASTDTPLGRVVTEQPQLYRRKAWIAAGAFLLLVAGTLVALWAARGNSPAPMAAAPPAAVARIDNNSGSVTTTAHDRHWGWHLAAAEGAVWQTGPEGLIKRDESTGEVEKIFQLDGQTHTVAAGFGSIWVTVVSAPNRATLVQVAPATDAVVGSLEVDPSGGGNNDIVWVAVGKDAVWVFNGNGDLWKIDPLSNHVLFVKHHVAAEGGGLAVGDGSVWVSDILRDEVVQLNESDGTELSTIPMTAEPDWLAFVGHAVWAQSFGTGTITPIDASNLRAGASLAAPNGQTNEAAGLGGLWIAADGVVSVVDPVTRESLEIPIGFPASSVAIDERTGAIWALHRPVVWAPGP